MNTTTGCMALMTERNSDSNRSGAVMPLMLFLMAVEQESTNQSFVRGKKVIFIFLLANHVATVHPWKREHKNGHCWMRLIQLYRRPWIHRQIIYIYIYIRINMRHWNPDWLKITSVWPTWANRPITEKISCFIFKHSICWLALHQTKRSITIIWPHQTEDPHQMYSLIDTSRLNTPVKECEKKEKSWIRPFVWIRTKS